jgi:hypothetical protein
MAVAKTSDYWTTRMDGGDPTDLPGMNNKDFTGSAGSASGLNWVVSGGAGYYTQTPDASGQAMTAYVAFSYTGDVPVNGTPLFSMDNGVHRVLIVSNGTTDSIKIDGTGDQDFTGLDLAMTEENAMPCIIRLTLKTDGSVNAYLYDIMEDDAGTTLSKSLTGATTLGSPEVKFGVSDGEVTFHTVYVSEKGAFNPDEIALADYTTATLIQTAFGIINLLRDSRRLMLKSVVGSDAINYGYDLSSNMASRFNPSIHVLLRRIDSPEGYALAGTSAEYLFTVELYFVVKGTDYRSSYRLGMDLAGEALDEIYGNTGLKGSTDSLIGHDLRLDSRLDPDDSVCIHTLSLRYMRRLDHTKRASLS